MAHNRPSSARAARGPTPPSTPPPLVAAAKVRAASARSREASERKEEILAEMEAAQQRHREFEQQLQQEVAMQQAAEDEQARAEAELVAAQEAQSAEQAAAAAAAAAASGALSAFEAAVAQHVPSTVTIVSLGQEVGSGKDFLKAIETDSSWIVVDCRSWLPKDPSVSIGHGQNGEFAATQLAMFSQDGFVELFKEVFQYIEHGQDKIVVMCNKGVHRSDTMGRTLEDAVNMITGARGERFYNAKHFALASALNWKGYKGMKASADEWSVQPWCTIEGGYRERRNRFAYEACMSSRDSANNWLAIHTWIESRIVAMQELAGEEDAEGEGVVHEDEEGAAEAEEEAFPPRPPHLTMPVTARPSSGASASSSTTKLPPPPPAVQGRGAKRERGSDEPLPGWATFEPDITVWLDLLKQAGCDDTSIQDLGMQQTCIRPAKVHVTHSRINVQGAAGMSESFSYYV